MAIKDIVETTAHAPQPAYRLLVVDDSETNRDILEAMLTRAGFEVRCAASGPEAIEASAHNAFDLIFMDCQMPKMDGFEATRQIRSQERAGRHVPIIALTANTPDIVAPACFAAGMDDVLAKPASATVLRAMLSKWAVHVDPTILADFRDALGGAGSPGYREAIATYIRDSRLHLDGLEQAVAEVQPDKIAHETHLLKGSSSYFGAHQVQSLCLKIESLTQSHQLAGVERFVTELRHEIQRVHEALELEATHGPA